MIKYLLIFLLLTECSSVENKNQKQFKVLEYEVNGLKLLEKELDTNSVIAKLGQPDSISFDESYLIEHGRSFYELYYGVNNISLFGDEVYEVNIKDKSFNLDGLNIGDSWNDIENRIPSSELEVDEGGNVLHFIGSSDDVVVFYIENGLIIRIDYRAAFF